MEHEYFFHYKLNIESVDKEHYDLILFSDKIKENFNNKETLLIVCEEFFE